MTAGATKIDMRLPYFVGGRMGILNQTVEDPVFSGAAGIKTRFQPICSHTSFFKASYLPQIERSHLS